MNCNTIKTMAVPFINQKLGDKLHNEILTHLRHCDNCLDYFIKKATDMNVKIDLNERVPKPPIDSYDSWFANWMDAAKAEDFNVLMQSKAIRDSVTETYDVSEDESETFRNFGLYIIKDICKKIDHLENCLKKTESVTESKKLKNKEKSK